MKILLTQNQLNAVAQTPSNECGLCDLILQSAKKIKGGKDFIIKDADEGMVEHISQICGKVEVKE